MTTIDWNKLTEEDLKTSDDLVNHFKKYLKKECGYTLEQAKFAADVIENPYSKFARVNKRLEQTIEINDKTYEVYFCTTKDSSPNLFEFYMLIDVSTLEEKEEEWFSYYLSKKKYILL